MNVNFYIITTCIVCTAGDRLRGSRLFGSIMPLGRSGSQFSVTVMLPQRTISIQVNYYLLTTNIRDHTTVVHQIVSCSNLIKNLVKLWTQKSSVFRFESSVLNRTGATSIMLPNHNSLYGVVSCIFWNALGCFAVARLMRFGESYIDEVFVEVHAIINSTNYCIYNSLKKLSLNVLLFLFRG